MIRFALCFLVAVMSALAVPSAVASSDRRVVLISDLHVGAGHNPDGSWKRIEDFRWQPEFEAFVDHISSQGKGGVDLVLVGDVFELWQSPTMTCSRDVSKPGCVVPDCHESDTRMGCSEPEAIARLAAVLAQHTDFVAALDKFASTAGNAVHFIPGNHDAALLFPGVRALLLSKFTASRVQVLQRGYFLSEDGLIYADHGHQFDEVNRFAEWPSPFVLGDGTVRMRKPWGENMVQQFYNQYEEVFPVIDNLADEKAGVDFAIKEAGLGQSSAAVGKFLRFFVFQQSISQAHDALNADGKTDWDYVTIKTYPIEFFIETLARAPQMKERAEEANRLGLANFDASELSDDEIDMICLGKDSLEGAKKCDRKSEHLSAAAKGILFTDDERRQAYLRKTLPAVALDEFALPKVYVLGHTHKAAPPQHLTVTGLKAGEHELVYANTGAFQRVASKDQLMAILKLRPEKNIRTLVPEDLPACYNFVFIEPYKVTPVMQLLQWSASSPSAPAAAFTFKPGSCLKADASSVGLDGRSDSYKKRSFFESRNFAGEYRPISVGREVQR